MQEHEKETFIRNIQIAFKKAVVAQFGPFDDAPNTMAIICSHVLEQGDSILYVSHDEDDGMWQFLCGSSHEISDAKLVALEEVFALDNSIAKIADMPRGCIAMRQNKQSNWKIKTR